jgi:hypothetical protein
MQLPAEQHHAPDALLGNKLYMSACSSFEAHAIQIIITLKLLESPAMDFTALASEVGSEAGDNQPPNPTHRYSAREWEYQRSRIEQHYVKERRSLKDVMDILQKESGFVATYGPLYFPHFPI